MLPTRLHSSELQADEKQKIQFKDSNLATFWLNAPKKYACLKNEATKALVQFGSTYMCVKQQFHAWCTSSQRIETDSLTLICKTT